MEQFEIRISKRVRSIALYTLFFFVVMHGYRYVSLSFSHDSLAFMAQADEAWQISLGRYIQPIYWKLRGHVGAPYIVGLLSAVWMILSVCGVADVLNIHSRIPLFLISGIMTGSLTLICSNATYIYLSDIYMLALFLNVSAVWICVRAKKRYAICAAMLLAVSAGLYQAYLQVFVVLVMVWAAMKILSGGVPGRNCCPHLNAAR